MGEDGVEGLDGAWAGGPTPWRRAQPQPPRSSLRRAPALTPEPFAAVPSFWSNPHGTRIRSVGLPAAADEARVVEHDLTVRRPEISYRRAGRLVGADHRADRTTDVVPLSAGEAPGPAGPAETRT
ncbi:hypothetical protein SHO565_72260 [Streptomyces sp. HO565]